MASVEICYSICLGDSITKEFVDPFHINSGVRVISNDSIFESDEHYGLMFKILTDNTVEFTDYRNNSIRYDSLVIPEHVFVNAKQYTVVGIGEGCMSRSYYTLILDPTTLMPTCHITDHHTYISHRRLNTYRIWHLAVM